MVETALPPAAALCAPSGDVPSPRAARQRVLGFIRRMHAMRMLGLALGFVCVASVFRLHDEGRAAWTLLALNAFAWPHLAFLHATRSANPARAEFRNLMLDSALGGVWIAWMQFSLLPSALLFTMLSADKLTVGGLPLALRTTAALVAACALTSAALGFPIDLEVPLAVELACLPLLIVYPMAISKLMHELSNRIARQNRRLALINTTDELTGLVNRREGYALAAHELAVHLREGRPTVLVVLDIDHFKGVNDRWGHPAGDQVLRGVAKILRESARLSDTVARLAGDEFLLVLSATDMRGALEVAGRIRTRLAAATFDQAPGLRVTVSLGAAEAHHEMMDVEDWMQQADAALYRAKNAGRDRVVCAPPVVDSEVARKSPRHAHAA